MKKIVSFVGATALVLGVAVPAFAHTWNIAAVHNGATAVSNTGYVMQQNGAFVEQAHVDGAVETEHAYNWAETGNAGAQATSVVVANSNMGWGQQVNGALIGNFSEAGANTGYVQQGNVTNVEKAHIDGGVETEYVGNNAYTGEASSTADSWTMVNTNVSWGCW